MNQWYHIVGVYNGSDTFIYVNGELNDSTTCSFTSLNEVAWQGSESTFIGLKDDSTYSNPFNGLCEGPGLKYTLSILFEGELDLFLLKPNMAKIKNIYNVNHLLFQIFLYIVHIGY